MVVHGKSSMLPSLTGHRDDPGALFDEVERVVLLKVTALMALDDLYRRSSNRQAAAMMTIQVMEVLPRPSGRSSMSKQSRSGIQEGKAWDWIFGKFPGRTRPAIRTCWNIIRPRGE